MREIDNVAAALAPPAPSRQISRTRGARITIAATTFHSVRRFTVSTTNGHTR